MTASAGAWYRVGTVNVTGGSQHVTGVSTNWQNDVISIAIGDIFTLDAKTWYEVTAVNSDTSITLDRDFEGGTANGQSYAIVRNTSGTVLTRIAGQVSVQFNQKQLFLDELRTWLNSDNASEPLTDSHGVKQSLKTPAQMVRDHDDKLAALDAIHPYPWAMRKAQFEAQRAANNEKYAASGFIHFGKHTGIENVIGEGLQTYSSFTTEGQANNLLLGRNSQESNTSAISKTDAPVLNMAGITVVLDMKASVQYQKCLFKFPPVEDGKRTYDSNTNIITEHASHTIAFASETDTNKVVINRKDMWGVQLFLRSINENDPFVYEYGCLHSLAEDINGVTTEYNSIRPASYFAFYKGDTTTRGKGVNWLTATEEQRAAICKAPFINLYFDDETGQWYQWTYRIPTYKGFGNGDWKNLDSDFYHASGVSGVLCFNQVKAPYNSQIMPQGILDVDPTFGDTNAGFFQSNGALDPDYTTTENLFGRLHAHQGLFVATSGSWGKNTACAVNGECFMLVCGTVDRLNMGLHHPQHNPKGTGLSRHKDGVSGSGHAWSSDSAYIFNSTEECFDIGSQPSKVWGYAKIINLLSGHPFNRFYDAIYASGQGGAGDDLRYSAWGLTDQDFQQFLQKARTGLYRGRNMIKYTWPLTLPSSAVYFIHQEISAYKVTDWDGAADAFIDTLPTAQSYEYTGQVIFNGESYYVEGVYKSSATNDLVIMSQEAYAAGITTGAVAEGLFLSKKTDYTVNGKYLQLDVIGRPDAILNDDDLKGGWYGDIIPYVPDGSNQEVILSKPIFTQNITVLKKDNAASSWSKFASTAEVARNSRFQSWPAESIGLLYYETNAKITEPVINEKPYRGVDSVGLVYASSRGNTNTSGKDLGFSLTGKIPNSNINQREQYSPLISIGYRSDTDYLVDDAITSQSTHSPISLTGIAGVTGYKALDFQVSKNNKGYLYFHYTELSHNGEDWGDDQVIHQADKDSKMLDDNSVSVGLGTHKLVMQCGWFKNDR